MWRMVPSSFSYVLKFSLLLRIWNGVFTLLMASFLELLLNWVVKWICCFIKSEPRLSPLHNNQETTQAPLSAWSAEHYLPARQQFRQIPMLSICHWIFLVSRQIVSLHHFLSLLAMFSWLLRYYILSVTSSEPSTITKVCDPKLFKSLQLQI